ncbi:MAG TPA: hypothetical protein VM182_00915 [Terriglobia bacterium]|nr:hypothetical protein [Terriglobia bacterium]
MSRFLSVFALLSLLAYCVPARAIISPGFLRELSWFRIIAFEADECSA